MQFNKPLFFNDLPPSMRTPYTCLNSFVATYRKYVLHTLVNFLFEWTLWTRRRKVVFRNLKQLVVVRCLLLPFSKGLRFISFELWLYFKIPTYLPKIISFEKLKRDLFLTWMKLFQVMQGGRNLFIFFTPFSTPLKNFFLNRFGWCVHWCEKSKSLLWWNLANSVEFDQSWPDILKTLAQCSHLNYHLSESSPLEYPPSN